MKKIFAVLAVVAFCASFASCNKECKCTTTMNGMKSTTTFLKDDLGIDKCSDLNEEMNEFGIELKVKCR